DATAGTGTGASPFWLSTTAHAPAARRLAGQPQARVATLSQGRSVGSGSRAQKARQRLAASPRSSTSAAAQAQQHKRSSTSATAQAPNEQGSRDFLSASLASGQCFRRFTVVDTRSRERPAVEVDRSRSGQRVVAVLERLAAQRGLPQVLQVLQV